MQVLLLYSYAHVLSYKTIFYIFTLKFNKRTLQLYNSFIVKNWDFSYKFDYSSALYDEIRMFLCTTTL